MMIYVLSGSPELTFKLQGQMCTHSVPIRVRLDRNVKKRLNKGDLIEYCKPRDLKKYEMKKVSEIKKEEKK
ncbi:MAG: hypothetical protein DRP15_04315, partial [Candidatus Aenigmatarchaeota archaeon]